MDKQARKLNTPREDGTPSEGGSEGGSNEDSDHDDKVRVTTLCKSLWAMGMSLILGAQVFG